jgi:hypothetical protein
LLLSGFNDPSTVGDQTVKKERKGKERKKPTNPTHATHHTTILDYKKKTPKMQKKENTSEKQNPKKRCKQETKR